MKKDLWINLPVRDVARARAFYEAIGLAPNPGPGNGPNSASFRVGDNAVVLMLFAENAFRGFARHDVADTARGAEVLLSLGAASRAEVDDYALRARAAGGAVFAEPGGDDAMYGCGFADPDGHRWNALFMA